MRLVTASGSGLWLAYGMNVHPAAGVEGIERSLEETVVPLRARLEAKGPFGVALRMDAETVDRLSDDDRVRARLRERLEELDLVPFTTNGFVVGKFHGGTIKSSVYRPSWRDPERLRYTCRLAEVMASFRGPGHVVSISTVPLAWRGDDEGENVHRDCAVNLARCARALHELEQETGVRVLLGIEPEPRCTIETTMETLLFWNGALAAALSRERAVALHLGVCFDVCHQAVVHEDVVASLALLRAARIPVVKMQASSALEVPDPRDPAAREALRAFAEPTYLHQVGARDAAGARRVAEDLAPILADPMSPWWDHRPWRVHFHVPVFREASVPPLGTTRTVLDAALREVARGDVTTHLEIETYSFGVLPEAERRAGSGFDLVDAIAREYEHVLSVLGGAGVRRADADAAP